MKARDDRHKEALMRLGIDVPYTLKVVGGRLVFHLYGGGVLFWPPNATGDGRQFLDNLSVKQLRQMAKERGLRGWSRLNKQALKALIAGPGSRQLRIGDSARGKGG